MPNASISIDGTEVISKTDGVVSQTFPGPNHTFTVKSVNQPITGANNSTNDDANSDQLAIYNGATKLWGINESGWVQNPNRPCFFVSVSSSYTPPDEYPHLIRFDSALYNVGNMYDTTNYRFTAPIDGLYLFGGMYRVNANMDYVHWFPYINGVMPPSSTHGLMGLNTTGYSNFTSGTTTYQLVLSAGDYVDFYIHKTGTSIIQDQSYLHGVYLG